LEKDWNKIKGVDKISDKLTVFDVNNTIRQSKAKTLEIVKQLNFKNISETALTIFQIMKKITEKNFFNSSIKTNHEINLKLVELLNDVKNNLVDVFHMFICKLHEKNLVIFSKDELLDLLAKMTQIFQMMIFFKDLKIKESFFKEGGDEEVLYYCKELIKKTADKLKNYLSSAIENEDLEKILQETNKNYLNSLYEGTIQKMYIETIKSPRISKNKMDFYLNDCDILDTFEERNFKKPLESLLINGANHKCKFPPKR